MLVSGCAGPPVTFTVPVLKCCVTAAGSPDTAALAVCGPKTLTASYLGGHQFAPGDSLRFILYSNPANPMGSIVQYSDSLQFPFLPGVMHFDSTYYLAVIAGPLLANGSLDASSACFPPVHRPKLVWHRKPGIAVGSPSQSVCYDGCTEVLFTFAGKPPFEFVWVVLQNGQVLMSQAEATDVFEKTVLVCPQDFGGMGGYINFRVDFFRDKNGSYGD